MREKAPSAEDPEEPPPKKVPGALKKPAAKAAAKTKPKSKPKSAPKPQKDKTKVQKNKLKKPAAAPKMCPRRALTEGWRTFAATPGQDGEEEGQEAGEEEEPTLRGGGAPRPLQSREDSEHATPRHAAKGGRRVVGFLQGAGRQNKGGECVVHAEQAWQSSVQDAGPKAGDIQGSVELGDVQRHQEGTWADPVQSQIQPDRHAAAGG